MKDKRFLIPKDEIAEHDNFIHWLVITAISSSGDSLISEVLDKAPDKDHHSIRLIMNGVDLDFKHTMSRLEEEYNRAIEKRAMEIFETRYQESQSKVDDAMEQMKKAILADVRKKHPDFKIEDW